MWARNRRPVAKAATTGDRIIAAIHAGDRIIEAGALDPAMIAHARNGNLEAFIGGLPWEQAALAWAGAAVPFEQIINRHARAEHRTMSKAIGTGSFDNLDSVAHAYAVEQGGQLIKNLSQAQTTTLRQILGEAFEGGLTVDQTAARIRQAIGLHPAWAQAVTNFEARMLANPEPGYSPARWRKTVETRTTAYAKRLTRKRSLAIARTEIMTAENLGRFANLTAAIREGTLAADTRKEWSPGPGACNHCHRVAGEIVPWNATFSNGLNLPPAHTHCRCTIVTIPGTGTPQKINWTSTEPQDIKPEVRTIRTDADDLTPESTAHWDDDLFAKKLREYGEAGDDAAIDRILELIDERAVAQAWAENAAQFEAWANKPHAIIKLDENPLTNPAARPERKLSINEQISEQFQDLLNTQMAKALDDLNGVFFNAKNLAEARSKKITEEILFTGPWQVANKYASDELKQWWLENGREVLTSFRYKITQNPKDKWAADHIRARGHEIGQTNRDRSVF